MKKPKAGLYDPYLDILGGGEKHILSILKVFEDQGYETTVFWDTDLKEKIESKLNLHFDNLVFQKNIFTPQKSILDKITMLKHFDFFFYVTDGSYFFSSAKKNIVFCMVPDEKLYTRGFFNRLKTTNWTFISNSNFTKNTLSKWGITSKVAYPFIDLDFLQTEIFSQKKEKIILSVGRFFQHLHTKNHKQIIQSFLKFQEKNKEYRLILAGGLKKEDQYYYDELANMIKSHSCIELKPNVVYKELIQLYQKARLFWHFAGFGVDEKVSPQSVEHLGMAPLEAMACGTIPFCFRAGGPKEIITDGKNGFLFETEKELIEKSENLIGSNDKIYNAIQTNGQIYVKNHFSYEVFKNKVISIFL